MISARERPCKVLVLGGTSDAQAFCKMLNEHHLPFVVSVATEAGASLALAENYEVLCERFDGPRFVNLIQEMKIGAVVDLTHPHAHVITAMASKLCETEHVPYFRYNRPEVITKETNLLNPFLHMAESETQAAEIAFHLGNRILVTGSKSVALYERLLSMNAKKTVIYRVLPKSEILAQIEDLGVSWDRIIAAKGPFNTLMNKATIEHFKIEVMIAKEAGDASGTLERLEAAKQMGIPLVMIQRPDAIPEAMTSLKVIFEALIVRLKGASE